MTDKRARFVDEYLVDLNATQAATRAGYSEKTAYSQGQRLLKDVEVAKAIAERQAERAERVRVTADDVLAGLLREAKGEGQDTHTSARVSAWAQIGKHLGMFGPKGTEDDPVHHEHRHNLGWADGD